ncbi:MAG: hypothetical protein JWP94_2968 [Mucilaginibacter sp.]|nr:hypothetical protein [Mucilaginibacter sp.]
MHISSLTLSNYGIYHGENVLNFPARDGKNVFIVSGNNGYGKTTLLTSLVWALYGKLMIDVDDKYRREIYDAGGYKKYAGAKFNFISKLIYEQFLKQNLPDGWSNLKELNGPLYDDLLQKAKKIRSYSVAVTLTDLKIPAIPCNRIEIIRNFDWERNEDTVTILIDGQENELTKEVGDEIFINDFILPKEIAKFFFFDAEKIVALAEIKSTEDKKSLSRAYSEVLGIKKYEDLKTNLEDIRIRFRKNSASEKDREKLQGLQKETDQLKKLLDHNAVQLNHLQTERDNNRQLSEQFQEKLIREGNSISLDELTDLKKVREKLTEEYNFVKNKMKDLLDLAPFAISGEIFMQVKKQYEIEQENKSENINPGIIKRKLENLAGELKKNLYNNRIKDAAARQILDEFENSLAKTFLRTDNENSSKTLLAFEDLEANEFEAIYNNLKYSFSHVFRQLIKDHKNNRIFFNKIIRKISLAETKENDLLIKQIRSSKSEVDNKVVQIEGKIDAINQEIGGYQKEIAIKAKVVSELSKKVTLDENDKLKDETAGRLIVQLDEFITRFRTEKKSSLELRLRKELNLLMHKKDFIQRVEVVIESEVIEIYLFDRHDNQLNTESFSKGEQQLYATALLKALVDESNISFPVFIDSPLQKFDKNHSINIIRDFYPHISNQVVLFPLLEKELSEKEFSVLLPNINLSYLILNKSEYHSSFEEIEPEKLFNKYKKVSEDVHNY